MLTWIAVWPTSMFISLILKPTLARNFPHVLAAGVVAAGIVVILYWIAIAESEHARVQKRSTAPNPFIGRVPI